MRNCCKFIAGAKELCGAVKSSRPREAAALFNECAERYGKYLLYPSGAEYRAAEAVMCDYLTLAADTCPEILKELETPDDRIIFTAMARKMMYDPDAAVGFTKTLYDAFFREQDDAREPDDPCPPCEGQFSHAAPSYRDWIIRLALETGNKEAAVYWLDMNSGAYVLDPDSAASIIINGMEELFPLFIGRYCGCGGEWLHKHVNSFIGASCFSGGRPINAESEVTYVYRYLRCLMGIVHGKDSAHERVCEAMDRRFSCADRPMYITNNDVQAMKECGIRITELAAVYYHFLCINIHDPDNRKDTVAAAAENMKPLLADTLNIRTSALCAAGTDKTDSRFEDFFTGAADCACLGEISLIIDDTSFASNSLFAAAGNTVQTAVTALIKKARHVKWETEIKRDPFLMHLMESDRKTLRVLFEKRAFSDPQLGGILDICTERRDLHCLKYVSRCMTEGG